MKPNKNKDNKNYIFIIIIISIIIIDQVAKIVLVNKENMKIEFEINSDKIIYIFSYFIILSMVFRFIRSDNQFINTKLKIFLSFILGGGISNIIDKIFKGKNIEIIVLGNLPHFNIADFFILIGWVSVVAIFTKFTFDELKLKRNEKIEKEKGVKVEENNSK